MKIWTFSAVVLFLSVGIVFGDDIPELLRRLDSDRLVERNAAETELIRRGPDVELLLPDEETLDGRPEFSTEVIFRLKNVFQDIRLRTIRNSLDNIKFHLSKVQPGENERSWVTLHAEWPEGVFPIRLVFPMNAIRGSDAEQRTLSPVIQHGVLEIPLGKAQRSGELVFALRGDAPQSLEGNCDVLLAIAEKTFEFKRFLADSPAAEIERTIRKGRTTVSLESVRFFSSEENAKNNRLTIRFRVHFDEAFAALESHRTWIYENETSLLLRSGKKIEPVSIKPTEQGSNDIVLAATFELPDVRSPQDEIVAFLYATPTIIVEQTVPFKAEVAK